MQCQQCLKAQFFFIFDRKVCCHAVFKQVQRGVSCAATAAPWMSTTTGRALWRDWCFILVCCLGLKPELGFTRWAFHLNQRSRSEPINWNHAKVARTICVKCSLDWAPSFCMCSVGFWSGISWILSVQIMHSAAHTFFPRSEYPEFSYLKSHFYIWDSAWQPKKCN